MSMPRLTWPEGAEVLPVAAVRSTLDALTSLATRHGDLVRLQPGLAVREEETAADVPPALEQIADELGGITLQGETMLDLLIEERADTGPYTLLGEPTAFYPLREDEETALILALDEHGSAGAVHAVDEDLALVLVAPDLPSCLEHLTAALTDTVHALETAQAAEETAGTDAESEADAPDADAAEEPTGPEIPLQDPSALDLPAGVLPPGTVAVADLREAPLGARVDLMEAELGDELLDHHIAFRAGGLLVCLVAD